MKDKPLLSHSIWKTIKELGHLASQIFTHSFFVALNRCIKRIIGYKLRFPQSIEDITPQWLSSVLFEGLADDYISSIEVKRAFENEGFNSNLWLIHKIEYADWLPRSLPRAFILKTNPTTWTFEEQLLAANRRMGEHESVALQHCLGCRTPVVYASDYYEYSGEFFSLIEYMGVTAERNDCLL